ncbi:MAG: homocysteine S-methyltransferase family protein [bacterium]
MELLKSKKIVIFDGGMGTQLVLRGAPPGGASNFAAPETVVEVQRAYVEAGADAIITNTFCMCAPYMEKNGVEGGVAAVNRAGAELARKAAGGGVAVLGDIGPTGLMLPPVGTATEEELYEAFVEQARALADGGVDAFIVETMMDVREAACAVRACREVSRLSVVASVTYATAKDGGRTMMGDRAADCAVELRKAGADVVGSNCGNLDPAEMAVVVESYKAAVQLPVLAQPNAGKPRLNERGETVYDMSPEDFAEGVAKCIDAGATLIGGCCGTTPEHIRALVKMAAARG